MVIGHGNGECIATPYGRIYVEREGAGVPLLLIPGGPGSSHSGFHPWFSALTANFEIVYHDPIGTGRSDGLSSGHTYSVEVNAEVIEAIRQHLGYDKVSLLGSSFGGMPLLAYLAKYPHHVTAAVLSCAQVNAATWQTGNIDHVNQALQRYFPERWEQLLALRANGVRSTEDAYLSLLDPAEDFLLYPDRDESQRPSFFQDPVEISLPEVYSTMCGDDPEWILGGTMAGFDPIPNLRGVEVPILVASGRWDGKLTVEMARCIAAELRAELYVFERSGHLPWAEQPEEFVHVVSEFLGRA
jgi:proline iminopeptidase